MRLSMAYANSASAKISSRCCQPLWHRNKYRLRRFRRQAIFIKRLAMAWRSMSPIGFVLERRIVVVGDAGVKRRWLFSKSAICIMAMGFPLPD